DDVNASFALPFVRSDSLSDFVVTLTFGGVLSVTVTCCVTGADVSGPTTSALLSVTVRTTFEDLASLRVVVGLAVVRSTAPSLSKSHAYFVIVPSGSDEALASNATFWPLALAVNLAIGSWLVVTLTTPDMPSTW